MASSVESKTPTPNSPVDNDNSPVSTEDDSPESSHHARRPMNAFLIFCKRHRSLVREKYPHLENRSITKILGEWWANLEAQEKALYTNLAKQYKEAFMKANPDFRWYKLPAPPPKSPTTRPSNQKSPKLEIPMSGIITPGKLADETQMGSLASLMSMSTFPSTTASIPKPPKKRYLEEVKRRISETSSDGMSVSSSTSTESTSEESACSALLCLAGVSPTTPVLVAPSVPLPSSHQRSAPGLHMMNSPSGISLPDPERPLNLSIERTFVTSQQKIINNVVDRLVNGRDLYSCAENYSRYSPEEVCKPNTAFTAVCTAENTFTTSTKIQNNLKPCDSEQSVLCSSPPKEDSPPLLRVNGLVSDSLLMPKKSDSYRDPVKHSQFNNITFNDVKPSETDGDPEKERVSSNTSNDSEAGDTGRRKLQRSCKGQRYREFMTEGRIPFGRRGKMQGNDRSVGAVEVMKKKRLSGVKQRKKQEKDKSDGDELKISLEPEENKETDDMNIEKEENSRGSEDLDTSEENGQKWFSTEDFDLEAKIDALPSLSLEVFQEKKRARKRPVNVPRKKAQKRRNCDDGASGSDKADTSPSETSSSPKQLNPQPATPSLVGSKKRKARRQNITRLEPVARMSLQPAEGDIGSAMGLATLAEVALQDKNKLNA